MGWNGHNPLYWYKSISTLLILKNYDFIETTHKSKDQTQKNISHVKYSQSKNQQVCIQKNKIDHHTMNANLKYQINNFNIKHHIQTKETYMNQNMLVHIIWTNSRFYNNTRKGICLFKQFKVVTIN
jgi:hypothetical protein